MLALLLLAMLALAGVAEAGKKGKEKEAAADADEDGAEELGESDFWGVEVAAGKKVKVALNDEQDQSLHITQARQGSHMSGAGVPWNALLRT